MHVDEIRFKVFMVIHSLGIIFQIYGDTSIGDDVNVRCRLDSTPSYSNSENQQMRTLCQNRCELIS